jgi:hypothetical protein
MHNGRVLLCCLSHITPYAECRYAECRYAECRYAECGYAECRYAECRYTECRSAIQGPYSQRVFSS